MKANGLDLTRQPGLRLARRPVGRCGEVRIAEPALATACDEHALPFLGEIRDELPVVKRTLSSHVVHVGLDRPRMDERADRHLELEIFPPRAGALRALPVRAALCAVLGMESIVNQCVEMRAGDEVHRSARSAVAAIGPAARYELLTAEAHGSASAGAGFDLDLDFVDKHHGTRRTG